MRPAQQRTQTYAHPAPYLGLLDDNSAFATQEARGAIWLYNLIADQGSVRVRPGTREFATGLKDDLGLAGQVRSIMSYNHLVQGGLQDVLIADASQSAAAAVLVPRSAIKAVSWGDTRR